MLNKITFEKNLFCFKTGDEFTLKPLTILVGEQGTGKSTLLKLLADQGKFGTTQIATITGTGGFIFHDFEKNNHRTDDSKANPFDAETYSANIFAMVNSRSQSHGEATKECFTDFDEIETDILILDEPDISLI